MQYRAQQLTEEEFHKAADRTLHQLHDDLDTFVEESLDFGDVSFEVCLCVAASAEGAQPHNELCTALL